MKAKETMVKEQDKPPSYINHAPRWFVAVVANIKGETPIPVDGPPDAGAEYDRTETIHSIQQAIESDGHRTAFIPADSNLPFALHELRPDICFNLAEGLVGDSREAQVPALLEMFRIPYTASRVLANAISLDKALTKRIWRDAGLPLAPFQEFVTGAEKLRPGLSFPLFVKPAREGTGMGVDLKAKVCSEAELRERVDWVIQTYKQPALVESFLPGREFTVAVLGRPDAATYGRRPELYSANGFHRFPILEIDSNRSVTPGVYGYKAKSKDLWENGAPGYFCPAEVDPQLEQALQRLARRAHQVIGAADVSRVDIRLDAQGNPCLMEINTLPGLNPSISDMCIMAQAEGLEYGDLILEILYLAASRYDLIKLPVQMVSRRLEPSRIR
ncbi:MAG TPA: hypothetical protein VF498_06510 [Anaerolineales bacterium]